MKLLQVSILSFGLALGLITTASLTAASANAETFNINVAAVDVNGTKFWLPSVIVAKKGDTVKIHAVTKIAGPNTHGFAIDQFKVETIVVNDKPTDIEFIANKAGIFPIRCQLHAPHIGGQLLVLE